MSRSKRTQQIVQTQEVFNRLLEQVSLVRPKKTQEQIDQLEETLNRLLEQNEAIIKRTKQQEKKLYQILDQTAADNKTDGHRQPHHVPPFNSPINKILEQINFDGEQLLKISMVLAEIFKSPLNNMLNRFNFDPDQLLKIAMFLADIYEESSSDEDEDKNYDIIIGI